MWQLQRYTERETEKDKSRFLADFCHCMKRCQRFDAHYLRLWGVKKHDCPRWSARNLMMMTMVAVMTMMIIRNNEMILWYSWWWLWWWHKRNNGDSCGTIVDADVNEHQYIYLTILTVPWRKLELQNTNKINKVTQISWFFHYTGIAKMSGLFSHITMFAKVSRQVTL